VIKTGLRKINKSYSKISLQDIANKLSLSSAKNAYFIVSKAIRDNVINAKIDYMNKYVESNTINCQGITNPNSNSGNKSKLRKVFDLDFTMQEFQDIMELVNAVAPLSAPDLETMFDVLSKNLHKKIAAQWGDLHKGVTVKYLDNFWESTFGNAMSKIQYGKWLNELKEKVHSDSFDVEVALSTFNYVIGKSVATNLGSIVQTQKRASNVDEFGTSDMSRNPNNSLNLQKVDIAAHKNYYSAN